MTSLKAKCPNVGEYFLSDKTNKHTLSLTKVIKLIFQEQKKIRGKGKSFFLWELQAPVPDPACLQNACPLEYKSMESIMYY